MRTTQHQQFKRKLVALAVAAAIQQSVWAAPTGLSVAAGQATLQQLGNLTQITNTPGAILNWQQFSIAAGETTQFIQQHANSQVFNRVVGGSASQILGSLQSNGQVFLINPSGVLIGQGASINTAGFLASTLNVTDQDLLQGRLNFEGSGQNAGAVVNQGSIRSHSGGSVVLIAPNVENSGIIHADGEVFLASGHSVTIVDLRHPALGVVVRAQPGGKALNLGQLIANQVSVYGSLVEHSGVARATAVERGQGGVLRFVADRGDLLIKGEVSAQGVDGQGGHVVLNGQRVAVLGTATIDASGTNGGGTIHVGGGWQGAAAVDGMANSSHTVVQAGARISANAQVQGDGGEVVVWADGHASIAGQLQARGGAQGGNGGRIETSGKQTVQISTVADTSSPAGQGGMWLIDPDNIRVVAAPATEAPVAPMGNIFQSPATDGESFIEAQTIVDGLHTNGYVAIKTTGEGSKGNITIEAPILVGNNVPTQAPTGSPELYLEASGDIAINAPVGLDQNQNFYNGFTLTLGFDARQRVDVNAPLSLGNSGVLNLAPYFLEGPVPTPAPGQLPSHGVFFNSGASQGLNGPLFLPEVRLIEPIFNPNGTFPPSLPPGEYLPFTVNAANLQVGGFEGGNLQNNFGADQGLQLFVSSPGGNEGKLGFDTLSARSISLFGDAELYSFSLFSEGSFLSTPSLFVGSGSWVNFGSGTFNLGKASVDGELRVSGNGFSGAFLSVYDLNLNGTLNMQPGFNQVNALLVRLGSSSVVNLSAGSFLGLGSGFNQFGLPQPEGFNPNVFGGGLIVDNGATLNFLPVVSGGEPDLPLAVSGQVALPGFGATLDVTGLNGQLDGPLKVNVGRGNHTIVTQVEGFTQNENTVAIQTLRLGSNLDISVQGDSMGQANLNVASSIVEGFSGNQPLYPSLSNVDFDAQLSVNQGGVFFAGNNIDLQGGKINANGADASVALFGRFRTQDLNAVNRSGGASLFVAGEWNNTLVDANNTGTSSALLGGHLTVFDDLTVRGGVLSAAGSGNSLKVQPGASLILEALRLNATVEVGPGAVIGLAAADLSTAPDPSQGPPAAPVFLDNAVIKLGGDALLLVEADASGIATLGGEGQVLDVVSVNQGNSVLAGRRVFDLDPSQAPVAAQTLIVEQGVRLNVQGNQVLNPPEPGVELFYGSNVPDNRPVFRVGELSPDTLAYLEYDAFEGATTITPTLNPGSPVVVDGMPGLSASACSPASFCVQIAPVQSVVYKGTVLSNLQGGETTLATSGVVFASGADLSALGFGAQQGMTINYSSGVNTITAADLASGLNVVNGPGSTIKLGANGSNETISNNIENNGMLELGGIYTLSGLLTGTGSLVNTGTLLLTNTSGSLITNQITNSGTLNMAGNYSYALDLLGTGSLGNSGQLALVGSSQTVQNQINNSGSLFVGSNSLSLTQNYLQSTGSTTVASGSVINGAVVINGGLLTGFGQYNGMLSINAGTFRPGASPGTVVVDGDLVLGAGSVLDIEFTGVQSPGVDHDFVSVSGNATLGGTLNLIDISGGSLPVGATVAFLEAQTIDGNFGVVNTGGVFSAPVVAGSVPVTLNTTVQQAEPPPTSPPTMAPTQAPTLAPTEPPPTSAPTEAPTVQPTQPPATQAPTQQPTQAPSEGGTSAPVASNPQVNQNIDQAFVPTVTNFNELQSPPQAGGQQQPQQDELQGVVQKSTGATTISQRSNDIELSNNPSNPQRPAAVCK